jgi:O-succinylbenzoic acid--CoA ligase
VSERWLRAAARARPQHAAVSVGDEKLSYADLEQRAVRVAACLHGAGVRRGDRVACLLEPGLAYVEIVHALMAAEATLVPLGTRLQPAELATPLALARPSLIVTTPERSQELSRSAPGSRILTPAALERIAPRPDFAAAQRLDPELDHAILFTSGTTGQPKGVRLSHANQEASARASAARLGERRDDRWLLCMPMHHIGGLAIVLRCAIAHTTLVVHAGFDADRIARALNHGEASLISMVPTMLKRVLEAGGPAWRARGLRALLLGGGPIPPELLDECLERDLPAAPTYGLTEAASQLATLAPADLAEGRGTAGPPLRNTELRIQREAGGAADVEEPGEILARGPQIMRGYLDDSSATQRTLAGGWLHTGDIGCLDAEGRLRVLDRRDDLIVTGGENVYPAEIEALLAAHPDLREAAVVARPDPIWGQRVHAVVVPEPAADLDVEKLDAWLRDRIAGFKRPRGYSLRTSLPRTTSGKLQRARIRREIESGG